MMNENTIMYNRLCFECRCGDISLFFNIMVAIAIAIAIAVDDNDDDDDTVRLQTACLSYYRVLQ